MPLHRLLHLIEAHSHELAGELLARTRQSPHLTSFSKVPEDELRQRVYEIYSHLGQWLMNRTESDIARQYAEIGARRYRQGVLLERTALSHCPDKRQSLGLLGRESWPGFEMEVLAEHEMFRRIDHFFNRAMYYAARGYEQAERAEQVLAGTAN